MKQKHRLTPTMLLPRAISFFMMIFLYGSVYGSCGSDTADLKWIPTQTTSTVHKVKLQMKSRSDYKTGSFTITFEFNENALAYKSYSPSSFKNGDYKHSIYAGSDGGTLVVKYQGNASNGTTVPSNSWIDVGEITFDVLDNNQNSNLFTNSSNTILRTSGNHDSDYVTLGTLTGSNITLPVTWLFVKAINYKDFVKQVVWATGAEINNDRFEVERSFIPLNENFSKVASVKGKGNSMEITHYKINDTLPQIFSGETVYYRIKQIDFNGAVSYSQVVKVVDKITEETQIGASLSSNPFTIHLKEIPDNLTNMVIHDSSGRELFAKELTEKITIINTDNYPSGIYYIIVYNYYNQTKFKIVK